MLSHFSSCFLVSGGLLKLAAGQGRRPGLIYCRSRPPTRQKCLAAPSLNTVYCAVNQAHNCSAATREGGGAPRRGLHASISSVTAAPEGAGQRTRPPVAIFRFGTRSFVFRFFLHSTHFAASFVARGWGGLCLPGMARGQRQRQRSAVCGFASQAWLFCRSRGGSRTNQIRASPHLSR